MLLRSKRFVRTVLGDISASALGHTQCHEHIWLRKGPSFSVNPALCMQHFAQSLAELQDYAAAGGSCIVDAQPGGFGRDAAKLEQLSAQSGVQIVAVTGFHKQQFQETNSPLPHKAEDKLTKLFIGEVQTGMLLPDGSSSNIKAGLIKAALESNGTTQQPGYEAWFSAVAEAAAETGAPVLVHTEKGADVPGLVRFFDQHGVSTDRIILCHLDRMCDDLGVHRELAASGCYLCYDSVNRLKYLSHQQELEKIKQMVGAGYASQLLLSLDTTAARLRAYGAADMGLDYILTNYTTMLLETGISKTDIDAMCRSNAAAALSIRI